MATHESAGLYLSGDLYLNPLDDDGNPTGLIGPLNAQTVAVTRPEPDAKERISRMKNTDGQLLDGLYQGKPSEIDMIIDDVPGEIMAMVFSGNVTDVSEGSGTVSDEPVSLIPGRWTRLAHRNLATSGISLAKASAPSTPLAVGADYEINHAMGMVKAIDGGAISATTACLIDYSHAAVTGVRANSEQRSFVKCQVLVDGKNKVNGKQAVFEAYEAALYNKSKVDFVAGEYVTANLAGKMRTPSGKSEPFYYEELTMA
jgi:hypothetical protein